MLTAFPDGSFDQVRLVVDVDSGSATDDDLAQLHVQVTWPVFDVGADGALDRPGPAPVTLDVPPRRHRIMARAGRLAAKRSVDVYADASVPLALERPWTTRGGLDHPLCRSQGTQHAVAWTSPRMIRPVCFKCATAQARSRARM